MSGRLSAAERILITVEKLLEDSDADGVSQEDLVVQAWRDNKKEFGIKGYEEEYPDSNRVISNLCGGKGMVALGLLDRVSPKCYAIGKLGLHLLRRLAKSADEGDLPRKSERRPRAELTDDEDHEMQRLLESPAFGKHREKADKSITFTEACLFWAIKNSTPSEEIQGRLAQLKIVLSLIAKEARQSEIYLKSGLYVSADDVQELVELHLFLMDRFARLITLLCNRTPATAAR